LKGGADLRRAESSSLAPGARHYFAVLSYITMNAMNEKSLQTIRHAVRDKKKMATVLGFGPRFLHSRDKPTKAAPMRVFLQIIATTQGFPVPGQKFTFGIVKAAKLRDFAVLAERGRALCASTWGELKSGLAL